MSDLTYLGSARVPELDDPKVGIYQRPDTRELLVEGPLDDDTLPIHGRGDLEGLTPGDVYYFETYKAIVTFLGTARMQRLNGQTVGVCKTVDADEYFILTNHGSSLGEVLTPIE